MLMYVANDLSFDWVLCRTPKNRFHSTFFGDTPWFNVEENERKISGKFSGCLILA